MRRIVCFGDSNTYGCDTRHGGEARYPEELRWTGRLAARLEGKAKIIGRGLNGREIPHTAGQFACFDGMLEAEREPEELWVMLGTNDLLQHPDSNAEDVAGRMRVLLERLRGRQAEGLAPFRIVLIAPPRMQRGSWVEHDSTCRESERLGDCYEKLAAEFQIACIRADRWKLPLLYDGVHLSEEGHARFAEAIYTEFQDLENKE